MQMNENINITEEAFEKIEGNHTFSKEYEKKKRLLLSAVKRQEKNHGKHLAKYAAVAAASVLVVLPATVYAADKIYQSFIEKNGYQTNIRVQQEEESVKEIVPVKLEATYLPEGSEEEYVGSFKYYVPEEGEDYGHSVSLNLTKLDVEDWTFSTHYTLDYQEFQAGKYQAYLVKRDGEEGFNQEMYVVFDDYGYMVTAYLGHEITEEEAVKIAEGLKLTETDEAHASSAASLAQIEAAEKRKGEYVAKKAEKNYYKQGELFENTQGFLYTVKSVEVLDNINSLNKEYFRCDGYAMMKGIVDASGNILPYERENIVYGDGVNTLNQLNGTESVNRRFVSVTLEVTNPEGNTKNRDDEAFVYGQIYFLSEMEENPFYYGIEPIYFDRSDYNSESSHYYFTTIEEGKTLTCHLGYLIDEDKLDEMYLDWSVSAEVMELVDIKQ